ncbi:MAG: MBL fold metallo-hydrolase [Saprospiraceae bacterium]
MDIAIFTFNAFSENTIVLHDKSGECIIIDPGCETEKERKTLTDYISTNNLKPVQLINTHCHIDHVLGNKYISELYNLPLASHRGEKIVLDMQPQVSQMYGIKYEQSPDITVFYDEGDKVSFGNTILQVLFTPGHSPASISLYCKDANVVIAGDVLFDGSIGRTDLPGGNFDTLKHSIQEKLYSLPEDVVVVCGHGSTTTIGKEKSSNPYVQGK